MLINSEVWDVRTRRLVRWAPALDGAAPLFSHVSSDVIYASQRRLTDDLGAMFEQNGDVSFANICLCVAAAGSASKVSLAAPAACFLLHARLDSANLTVCCSTSS